MFACPAAHVALCARPGPAGWFGQRCRVCARKPSRGKIGRPVMPRFLLSAAPRARLAAAVRLPRRVLVPAFAGAAETAGAVPAVKDVAASAQAGTIAASIATRPPAHRPPARRTIARGATASRAAGHPTGTATKGAAAIAAAPADTAHLDDIKGAFGTVRAGAHDEPASWSRRLLHVRPGRAGLRHPAAVGPRAADTRADR